MKIAKRIVVFGVLFLTILNITTLNNVTYAGDNSPIAVEEPEMPINPYVFNDVIKD